MSSLANWDGKYGASTPISQLTQRPSNSLLGTQHLVQRHPGFSTGWNEQGLAPDNAENGKIFCHSHPHQGSHDASQLPTIIQTPAAGPSQSYGGSTELNDASKLFDVDLEMDLHSEDAEGEDDEEVTEIPALPLPTTKHHALAQIAEYGSSQPSSPAISSSPLFTPINGSPIYTPAKSPYHPLPPSSPLSSLPNTSLREHCSKLIMRLPPRLPKRVKPLFLSHVEVPSLPAGLKPSDYTPVRRRQRPTAPIDQYSVGTALNVAFQRNAQLGELHVRKYPLKRTHLQPVSSSPAPVKLKYKRVASSALDVIEYHPSKKSKIARSALPGHPGASTSSSATPFPVLNISRPSYVSLALNTRFIGASRPGSVRVGTTEHVQLVLKTGVGSSNKNTSQSMSWFQPPLTSIECATVMGKGDDVDELWPGPPVLPLDEAVGDVDDEETFGPSAGDGSFPSASTSTLPSVSSTPKTAAKRRKLTGKSQSEVADEPPNLLRATLSAQTKSTNSSLHRQRSSTFISRLPNSKPTQNGTSSIQAKRTPKATPYWDQLPSLSSQSPSSSKLRQLKAASSLSARASSPEIIVVDDTDDSGSEPRIPSAKALGKRKMTEPLPVFASTDAASLLDIPAEFEVVGTLGSGDDRDSTDRHTDGPEYYLEFTEFMNISPIRKTVGKDPALDLLTTTPPDPVSGRISQLSHPLRDPDMNPSFGRPPSPFCPHGQEDYLLGTPATRESIPPSLASPLGHTHSGSGSEQRETLYYNHNDFLVNGQSDIPGHTSEPVGSGNTLPDGADTMSLVLHIPELEQQPFVDPFLLGGLGLETYNNGYEPELPPSPTFSRSDSPVISHNHNDSSNSQSFAPSTTNSRSSTSAPKTASPAKDSNASLRNLPRRSAKAIPENMVPTTDLRLSSDEDTDQQEPPVLEQPPAVSESVQPPQADFGCYIFPPKDANGQVVVVEMPTSGRVRFNWPTDSSQSYFCHQCRTKTQRLGMHCGCSKAWCIKCVLTRYDGIIAFDASRQDFTDCPFCSRTCNCDQCCAKRGDVYKPQRRPTTAKPAGVKPSNRVPKPKKLHHNYDDSTPGSRKRSQLGGKTNLPPVSVSSSWLPSLAPPPAMPIQYWGTIYNFDGEKMGRAYTAKDGNAQALFALPVRRRVFIGAVQESWKFGPRPVIADLAPTPAALRKGTVGREVSYVGDKTVLRLPYVDDPESGNEAKRLSSSAFSWFWDDDLTEEEDSLPEIAPNLDQAGITEGLGPPPGLPGEAGRLPSPSAASAHSLGVNVGMTNREADPPDPGDQPVEPIHAEGLGLAFTDLARAIELGLGQVGIHTSLSVSPE